MTKRQLQQGIIVSCLFFSQWATAQVSDPKYRDYFLVGRFGEVCTMCEVTVLCSAGDASADIDSLAAVDQGVLYHFQTRSFWSQMGTIWEWFVANFDDTGLAASGHTRPVHRYPVSGGALGTMRIVEARLRLEPPLIDLESEQIDRINSTWRDSSNTDIGQCMRTPLWDTLELIQASTGEKDS